jgi:hypothetical protein
LFGRQIPKILMNEISSAIRSDSRLASWSLDDLIGNSPHARELGDANRQSRLSTYPLPMLPE